VFHFLSIFSYFIFHACYLAITIFRNSHQVHAHLFLFFFFFFFFAFAYWLQIGTSSFAASAHYTHRFSSKSHGRIAGRFGRYLLKIVIKEYSLAVTNIVYMMSALDLLVFHIPICTGICVWKVFNFTRYRLWIWPSLLYIYKRYEPML